MKIMCSKCGYVIDRDIKIAGKVVEEYNNIYGTTLLGKIFNVI